MNSTLSAERYTSKVGAEFGGLEQADRAVERLKASAGIDASQIRIVGPNDPSLDRKLEPEPRGVAKTIVRSHVILGAAGLLVGLIAAFVLEQSGIALFAWSAPYTYGTFGFVGAMLGMLLAGLFSVRPDHDPLITRVKEGVRAGRWYLLVHTRNDSEKSRAKQTLEGMGSDVLSTL
jgi:hypothetical protein